MHPAELPAELLRRQVFFGCISIGISELRHQDMIVRTVPVHAEAPQSYTFNPTCWRLVQGRDVLYMYSTVLVHTVLKGRAVPQRRRLGKV